MSCVPFITDRNPEGIVFPCVCFFFFIYLFFIFYVCLRDNSKNPYPISTKFSHNLLRVKSSDAIANGHPTATTFGHRPQHIFRITRVFLTNGGIPK